MPCLPNLLCFGAKNSKKKTAPRESEWEIYRRERNLEQIEIDKDFAKGPGSLLPRIRTLTLGSHQPSPGANVVHANAQTASAFFTKLPPDIRGEIYTHLLGNRTIHVEFEHCMRRPREPQAAPHWRHYSLTQSIKYGEWKWPTTWSQWHCVCHRRDPAMSPLDDCVTDELWHTARDHINAEINTYGDSGDHADCKLEIAMLFACRRAYSELIHVLYSANTFFFHQPHHLARFIQFTLPQRVQSLTSVDVVYACKKMLLPDMPAIRAHLDTYHNSFVSACETLGALPHLRSVRISVPSTGLDSEPASSSSDPSSGPSTVTVGAALEQRWLVPMDALVTRRRGSLRNAELWMPESSFEAVDRRGGWVLDVRAPRLGPHPDWFRWRRFWRRVAMDEGRGEGGGEGGLGYWIHSRPDGVLMGPICTMQKN